MRIATYYSRLASRHLITIRYILLTIWLTPEVPYGPFLDDIILAHSDIIIVSSPEASESASYMFLISNERIDVQYMGKKCIRIGNAIALSR